jgi:uncharacterized protein YbjT (DUF2867 family)
MLGQPVAESLMSRGHRVRALVRDSKLAAEMLGSEVEVIEGSALERSDVGQAISGCDAVHVNLAQEAELTAMQHVVALAGREGVKRISYVSATTAREENRWFDIIDVKMRTEEVLRSSGIANVVFCPTWVMETLRNFARGSRPTIIVGRNPPKLHFFAARDFGRMVADSYSDDRALGKRLFIHGPEGVTLPDALERFYAACYPNLRVMRMKVWQARLVARMTRRKGLAYVANLIAYFDRVGELGNPAEANALLGAPSTTLDEWFTIPRGDWQGLPH